MPSQRPVRKKKVTHCTPPTSDEAVSQRDSPHSEADFLTSVDALRTERFKALTPASIVALQQRLGNASVQRLVAAGSLVGLSTDPCVARRKRRQPVVRLGEQGERGRGTPGRPLTQPAQERQAVLTKPNWAGLWPAAASDVMGLRRAIGNRSVSPGSHASAWSSPCRSVWPC